MGTSGGREGACARSVRATPQGRVIPPTRIMRKLGRRSTRSHGPIGPGECTKGSGPMLVMLRCLPEAFSGTFGDFR